jgi:Ca2+-binding RTX toxin-like protein
MAKFDDGQPGAQVVLAGLESTFGDLVNYDHHRLQGEYYATAYGNIDPSLFNPFVHAYVSAALTRDYGFAIAMAYGNGREQRTTAEYYFAFGEDHRKDTYRDLFNNHVGALIGNYADDHELNDGQVAALVQDALDGGELITDIRTADPSPDPRIPEITFSMVLDIPFDGKFNGWPEDFYEEFASLVTWEPPVGQGGSLDLPQFAETTFVGFVGGSHVFLASSGGTATGTALNDTFSGSGSADIVTGEAGDDVIAGGGGADTLSGGVGDDVVVGGAGNDVLFAGVQGTGGYEYNVDTGDDVVVGGAGDDTIVAADGNDILIGGAGNDQFQFHYAGGSWGTSRIVWGGDGSDSYYLSGHQTRVLFLHASEISAELVANLDTDALLADITAEFGDPFDYIVLNPDAGDSVYVHNSLVSSFSIDETTGTVTNEQPGQLYVGPTYTGPEGTKVLYRPIEWMISEEDYTERVFVGARPEQDVDIYQIAPNEGIFSNTGYYQAITVYDHSDGLSGQFEIVGFTEGSGGISISGNGLSYEYELVETVYEIMGYGVEDFDRIEYDPGGPYPGGRYIGHFDETPELGDVVDTDTTSDDYGYLKDPSYDSAQAFQVDLSLYQRELASPGYEDPESLPGPTDYDDTLIGSIEADTIDALAGKDIVFARAGDDTVQGGAGRDHIFGEDGADSLAGGQGDDQLLGGEGDDVLHGGAGDDLLDGEGGTYNQVDYDGGPGDYTFTENLDGTVTVTSASWGTDTLKDIHGVWFTGAGQWYSMEDLLGPTGPGDTITGTSGDDYLPGTTGHDTILGGDGNDTLYGDLGDDILDGQGGTYNQVDYEGEADDYTFTRNLDDSVTVSHPVYGTDTLRDIDGVWFLGEEQWYSLDDLAPSTVAYVGTGNANYFGGTALGETINFTGGTGNYVEAGGGDDIIVFAGDVADYQIIGEGEHFTISAIGSSDTIQFKEVEYIRFADSSEISLAAIVANSGYDPGEYWFEPEPIGGLV